MVYHLQLQLYFRLVFYPFLPECRIINTAPHGRFFDSYSLYCPDLWHFPFYYCLDTSKQHFWHYGTPAATAIRAYLKRDYEFTKGDRHSGLLYVDIHDAIFDFNKLHIPAVGLNVGAYRVNDGANLILIFIVTCVSDIIHKQHQPIHI